ncbi:TPA: ABC transporter ATP-binding protein [Candidatus Woesearchaeota archaeon]|nr:ABC transporter ATP-binding protein [Candidatus Woesearchaeota archaeon]
MLEVKNIHKEFGGIKAVDGCSFKVEKNTITALIGPNGAGKTTLFNIITGFMKQDSGKIIFNDKSHDKKVSKDISNLPDYKRARLGMSRTFQTIRLFPKMTVMENLLVAMPDSNENFFRVLFWTRGMKREEKMLVEKALELLKFVDLHAKMNELAGNLSYGQQKLLEIAKALASEPEILMLDEPAAGVNPTMLNKIHDLMLELKKRGKTILFIEHNMEFVMNLADKVVVLDYGKEIANDVPANIKNNKQVIDAYLGVCEK